MPIYEFRCTACSARFSEFYRSIGEAQAAARPPCPACSSLQTQRLLSAFAVAGAPSADAGQVSHDQAQADLAKRVTPKDQIERWRGAKPSS